MEQRYVLRFESGERAGETIPIEGREFTIGRKPGHSLQILDNSVSGRHAEIVIDATGPLLRDLGSTNGTRVGGERVIETRLAHGDHIVFGNVQVVILDAALAAEPVPPGPAPTPDAGGAGTGAAGDTLLRVSPEVLARSRKRPVAGVVGLLVLIGAAGGLWYFLRRPSPGGEHTVRPARASAENLLGDDFSFETEPDGWKAVDGAPAAFEKSAQGRYSGTVGLLGDLADGGWALHRSREVHAEAGRALLASAKLRADGGAVGQVGIEFSPVEGADAAGAVVAWSRPYSAGEFGDAEVTALVPPGFETARLLLLARTAKSGTVAADDAVLVARDAAAASGAHAVAVGDWQLVLVGEPATAALLARFGRALVTGLSFCEGPTPPESAQAGPLAASEQPGKRLALASEGRAALGLRAETALVRSGLATIGADGYAAHGLDFEQQGVTSILLGKGQELVRVAFAAPVSVKGVAEGLASRIEVHAEGGAPLGEVVLQLDFTEERRKAGDLAYAARNAEKKGDLGECLKQWAELLNGVPYEEALVTEADGKRATLVQQGLSELLVVHQEIERARFFRLVDLYRQCRDKALAVGARFHGSEVDAEAQKVAAEVDQDLVGLEADLAAAERKRLEAILAALEARKATGLAAEVRAHLEKVPKRAADTERKD